ncbi:matrixin family metalloprotease [Nocardioides sp.]|uniref:matrixin family metalloprotease n=1 Tax=Nocardioides sp. TaxID=35761 RepID=UPI003D0F62F0
MTGSISGRCGAILVALAVTVPLAATMTSSTAATPATTGQRSSVCDTRGPIAASALVDGVSGCSLVGRVVVSGSAAVVVPRAGYGVGADGVAGAGSSDAASLQVTNLDGVVRATVDGDAAPASRGLAARAAGACSAGQFKLASGRHPWGKVLSWRYHRPSEPKRYATGKALAHIRAGMTNMRTARNDCNRTSNLSARARYAGVSATGPGIRVKGSRITCGKLNSRNVVGWGALPNSLLGWTCYWWGGSGKMIAADMRLSTSAKVVTAIPGSCTQRYDLQSLATHEWGHAWGLGHVSNPNLTMHHFLPACSTAFRTLGLGDIKGMRQLY